MAGRATGLGGRGGRRFGPRHRGRWRRPKGRAEREFSTSFSEQYQNRDAQASQQQRPPTTQAEQAMLVRLAEGAVRLGSTPAVRVLVGSLLGGSLVANVVAVFRWLGARQKERGRLEQRQQRYEAAADIVLGKQTGSGQDSLDAKVSRIDRDLRGDPDSLSDDERLGVKGKLKQMDSKIEHMDSKIEHMDSKIQHMDSKIEHMDSKIQHMDSQMQHMDSKIEHMDSQMHSKTNMSAFLSCVCAVGVAYLVYKNEGKGSGQREDDG